MKKTVGIVSSILIANISMAMELTFQDAQNKSIVPNFANALAKQHIEKIVELGPNRGFKLISELQYVGNNIDDLAEFKDQLNLFLENYAKGDRLLRAEKIVLNAEDTIKISNFSNYLVNSLFSLSSNIEGLSPTFKEFKEKNSNMGMENYFYKQNSLFYTLMYFFDDNKSEVQIPAAKGNSYNNYRFTFSPCSDNNKYSGEPMTLAFKEISINQNLRHILFVEQNNILSNKLFYQNSTQNIEVFYEFSAFKVAADTYRFNVILSTREAYSSVKQPQKATNFIVRIK